MDARQLLFGRTSLSKQKQLIGPTPLQLGRQPGARLPTALMPEARRNVGDLRTGESGWVRLSAGFVISDDRSIYLSTFTTFVTSLPDGAYQVNWVKIKRTASGITLWTTSDQTQIMRRGDHPGAWYDKINYLPVTDLLLTDV